MSINTMENNDFTFFDNLQTQGELINVMIKYEDDRTPIFHRDILVLKNNSAFNNYCFDIKEILNELKIRGLTLRPKEDIFYWDFQIQNTVLCYSHKGFIFGSPSLPRSAVVIIDGT